MAERRSRKSILALGLSVAFLYAGIDWIEAVEIATVRAKAVGKQDRYARVFVVDDPPHAWIRAERPDRLWLEAVRVHPEVILRRGDVDQVYDATVWNGRGTHERVDRLFRAKYGVLDVLSGWVWRRDAVPVRLERSY